MFQVTSADDVAKLLRKHNYDELIHLAKSCDDDEYGKAVLNRLMKDLLSTKAGELLRELLKRGATLETKAKPGPKPGAKRKSSPAPVSPARKKKQPQPEPEEPTIATVAAAAEAEASGEDAETEAFDSPKPKKKT
jgi:hypothetical protein